MLLPTEVLDILARVPFKHLVRTTCCLSRVWRRRWESVPILDIELPPGSSSRVLWRFAAPVRGFCADVCESDIYRAARWLRALARKRVRGAHPLSSISPFCEDARSSSSSSAPPSSPAPRSSASTSSAAALHAAGPSGLLGLPQPRLDQPRPCRHPVREPDLRGDATRGLVDALRVHHHLRRHRRHQRRRRYLGHTGVQSPDQNLNIEMRSGSGNGCRIAEKLSLLEEVSIQSIASSRPRTFLVLSDGLLLSISFGSCVSMRQRLQNQIIWLNSNHSYTIVSRSANNLLVE